MKKYIKASSDYYADLYDSANFKDDYEEPVIENADDWMATDWAYFLADSDYDFETIRHDLLNLRGQDLVDDYRDVLVDNGLYDAFCRFVKYQGDDSGMKKYVRSDSNGDIYDKFGTPITPFEFAKRYFKNFKGNAMDISIIHDLYDYMEEHPDEDYWDYDVDDYEVADDVDAYPVVLVEDAQGDARLFETVPTPNDGV